MSTMELVPATTVEHIVGQQRWHYEHIGMYDGRTITILHSRECRRVLGEDLFACPFSVALGTGTTSTGVWIKDRPQFLEIRCGELHPGMELPRVYIPTTRQCSE